MAAAPIALAGSFALAVLLQAIETRPRRAAGVGWTASVVAIAALAAQVIPQHRADLAGALAGAGDTGDVARLLEGQLRPGQTVLNLEGDGSANLFAFARVPVTAGLSQDPRVAEGPRPVAERLLQLDARDVGRALRDLGVAYVVVGNGPRFWGQGVGYSLDALLAQPQLEVAFVGSDLTVLRYRPGPAS
jgi:hypothetical protein